FAPEAITLGRLAVGAAGFGLTAQGRYGLTDDAVAATAHLALPDLARLAPALAGSGEASVTVSGTAAQPRLEATLQAAALRGGGTTIAAARAAIALSPTGDLRTAPIGITADGRIEGVTLASGAVPAGLGDAIDWRLAGRLDPQSRTLTADTISVTDRDAALNGSMTASAEGAAGALRLSLPNLAALDGGMFAGALGLAAEFHAARDGSGTAVLSGALDAPGSGMPQLDALLGPRITLAGTIERGADGALAAHDIALDAAEAHVSATGSRAPDGTLDAAFEAQVPHLAALDPRVAGAATLRGSLSGPSDALTGMATLEAPSLAIDGIRVDRFSARLSLARAMPLAATLEASFRAASIDTALRADISRDRSGVLRVANFRATAAGARAEGAATIAGTRIDGTLTADVPDLRPFSALAARPLTGHAKAAMRIAGDHVVATLDAQEVAAGGTTPVRVRQLHLAADITDLFERPAGRAELGIVEAAGGAATLSSAKLTARSARPGRFALDLAAAGTASVPFRVTAAATLAVAQGAFDLDLARLQGMLGSTPFALRAPLAVAWHGDTLRAKGLSLALGKGSITGDGALARRMLSLHLLARDLQVGELARLANADVTGTLGFELTLSGTRDAPQGRLIIDGETMRFAAASRPDLPALGAVADGTWRNGRLDMKGRLAGPQDAAAIGWTASMPLVLARTGFAVSLPREGAVTAHLEGEGQLAAFADLLPNPEDRVEGRFAIDVNVAGTVGSPDASGRVTITDGRYENLFTGAILTNVRLTLEGQRDHLVLRDFAADDGAGGSASASGALDLAASGGPALAFEAALGHMRVLNRDEGQATASGTLRLSGPLSGPRLDAKLTVDQADLAVPERLPQSSRPVAATIIDSKTGTVLATPERSAPSPLPTIILDVQVEIPGKTFVRGHGLDSEWRGHVRVTGTAAAPEITGRLEVVRGSFSFLGKDGTVRKGVITFSGGKKIDPSIDIEARVPSTDATAIVTITGTATQPSIALSSEPALPRDEILSRVLFGTSMNQISPAQGLEIASAAASLAGGGGLDVLGTIRRGLGLDRLALGSARSTTVPGIGVPAMGSAPGMSAPATGIGTTPLAPGTAAAPGSSSGIGGTTLSAGKYVANGVYVGVNQGLQAGSSSVDVSIDVSRHISIDTQAGQASGTGVGINWKLDY
ncbi:MAG TPA: translocation/assembly module TamB domain-containing protein, partial [Stellaceae bacterium]|nr:translocation/assembly module TamB domain-containing protein [Stellaceae bacterium]